VIRENRRIVVLIVLVVASGVALFASGVVASGDGPTNLQFGIALDGGTQIRAPVVGVTAEGVDVSADNPDRLQRQVAGAIDNVSVSEVQTRPQQGTVEVFARVSPSRLRAALDAQGVAYETVRSGVTSETRSVAIDVVESKINAGGLSGGTAQQIQNSSGRWFIEVEAPGINASTLTRLVNERGLVQVVAAFPGDNDTYRTVPLLEQGDYVRPVRSPVESQQGPAVPLTLSGEAAENFSSAMQQFGFTSQTSQCRGLRAYRENQSNAGYCLVTVLDGEPVYAAGMGPGLAQDIDSGVFVEDRSFIITAGNFSQARELQINLQAGALPAPLAVDQGTVNFIAPTFAERAKGNALITGIAAVLAVSLVVYFRYGNVYVAAPMVVTALSEVVILLGFAAAIRLAVDLSHIAGFIAVIGTGVDDLVIIADEVLTEDVSSDRVFSSRFRKALWVIGAAAVTTIIAMSPLAVLSLGDLRGFAIVTILGVLVGVIVTRPAYGDILRRLLTDN
jgi:preprotein translocase subunit SecD